MKFTPLAIDGAYLIESGPHEDERGSFTRIWCAEEFLRNGLNPIVAQCSLSVNRRRNTVRGLHYQAEPHGEEKTIRCVRGAVYDVLLDLRRQSPTYRMWLGEVLTSGNQRMLYVPRGVAHGFQTMADHSELLYFISVPYEPASARGIRWNDPAFGIRWMPVDEEGLTMSERDREFPLWEEGTAHADDFGTGEGFPLG